MSVALPYSLRLLCQCLAAGAICYAWGSVWIMVAAGWVLRGRPSTRVALVVRLLPLYMSAAAVVCLCVPSYLWLEPRGQWEQVSAGILLAALAGAVLLLVMLARAAGAVRSSWRYARRAERCGRRQRAGGERVLVVPAPAPALALAGLVRPRLLVSEQVWRELRSEQLAAGLAHERAHLRSADNFKRLLIHATPLPGTWGKALEAAWSRWAEWAADDRAVAGSRERALALASTLVAVARWAAPPIPAPVSCLAGDLEARVERLLEPHPQAIQSARGWWTSCAAFVLLAWLMLQPTTLLAAHAVLEHLTR